MKREDFVFKLKQSNIVQFASKRGDCRLLVLQRSDNKSIHHRYFNHLLDYLNPGDVIVVNNSKVIPTRFWGLLETGGQVEVTLVQRLKTNIWSSFIRPQIGLKRNSCIYLKKAKIKIQVVLKQPGNMWYIKFFLGRDELREFLRKKAKINLPFYLRYSLKNERSYQTIYAHYPGSCQPPTAGLHFTHSFMTRIIKRGVKICYITLHISGSILPFVVSDLKDVRVGREWYSVPKRTAYEINRAKKEGKKIIAVGTTVIRTLESVVTNKNRIVPKSGWTALTILPGFKFKIADAFLTNFHMPCSSHLLLTSAFGGREYVLHAYREALKNDYSFLDFGDAMLVLK